MKKTTNITLALLFSTFCGAAQQAAPLWGKLDNGPYAVGYKTLWVYDYSRTWGNQPRPIRLHVWYPAEPNGIRMLFEEYVYPRIPDTLLNKYEEVLVDRDQGDSLRSLRGLFKASRELYTRLLKTPVNASKNATPAKGKFPVIIYSLGQDDYSQENTVLCEYLATHGFIVMAPPQIGVSPRKSELMIDEETSFETQVRDIEFAIAQAFAIPQADVTKIGCIGMSMGGVYTLLAAMRNNSIRLLIGLDPSYMWSYEPYGYKYWQAKYYDNWNLKIPLIALYRDDPQYDHRITDDLKFARRYLIGFKDLIHADFTSYPMYTLRTPSFDVDAYALQHRSQQFAAEQYQEICRIVLKSVDRYLLNDSSVIITTHDGQFKKPVQCPNEEEFCTIIEEQGLSRALAIFENAKTIYPRDTLIREKQLRRIGFEYSLSGNFTQALGVYTLYVAAYPQSFEAYKGLGEMQMRTGRQKEARTSLEKAKMLNPNDEQTSKWLDQLNR